MGRLLEAIIRSKGSYLEALNVLGRRRLLRRVFGMVHRYADEAKIALDRLADASRSRTI